mmetsp:Transcript_20575/g.55450  ORF Transcript_20575/g.55450 Transcript_20575/m.55450 type:complete len:218 (+) Transcript_20575:3-656(+)
MHATSILVSAFAGAAVTLIVTRLRARKPSRDSLAKSLGLIAHPEGGFFLETYRAGSTPMESRGKTDEVGALMAAADRTGGKRNTLTSIYYMLTADSPRQWWANNMSDHVHYHHGGGRIIYRIVHPDGRLTTHTLGPECPQLVVLGGCFKCAELEAGAEYGLLGEAVSPGFDFRDFAFVTAEELAGLVSREAFADLQFFLKAKPESEFDDYYDKPKTA